MCIRGRKTLRESGRQAAVLVPRSVWRHTMTAMTAMDLALEARSEQAAADYVLVILRELQEARKELG